MRICFQSNYTCRDDGIIVPYGAPLRAASPSYLRNRFRSRLTRHIAVGWISGTGSSHEKACCTYYAWEVDISKGWGHIGSGEVREWNIFNATM